MKNVADDNKEIILITMLMIQAELSGFALIIRNYLIGFRLRSILVPVTKWHFVSN